MTIWFVSRHAGALEWARRHDIGFDRHAAHLNLENVVTNDTVIGSLPVNSAARVCEIGAQFFNLSLDLPADARGRELSADDLERYGARIERFDVRRKP